MAVHTALTLFKKNIESATDCIALYDAIVKLKPKGVNIEWILRAAVVFTISSLDRYFHDKVKYRIGKYTLLTLPPSLSRFKISIADISDWDKSKRKGNVLRNWVDKQLSIKPLQTQGTIADALQLADINGFWDKVEPDNKKQKALLKKLGAITKRRNQISHEGDRKTSRRSGKTLREIDRDQVEDWRMFIINLVVTIEKAVPA